MKLRILHQLFKMSRYLFYGLFLQVFFCSMILAKDSYGQKSIEKIYLDLKFKGYNLAQVFERIESQTEFKFVYDKKFLSASRLSINLSYSHESLAEILRELSKQTNLKFRRVNNNITVGELDSNVEESTNTERVSEDIKIQGTVKGEEGEELPGVNIIVKGTTNGTITDLNGAYSITAQENAVLVFSFVGYQSKEISVDGKSAIEVTLLLDAGQLEEIIVVGYGTQKKSDIVGSVASVSSERLEKNANPNLFQAIQASVPGLNITRGSGEPGSSGSIQIRGLNSISANNEPLIVVDGIPFAGNIRDISPNDISSVEILKDASASAIYGSRAASGVILITTKKGSVKGTTIEFNSSWSIQNEAVTYQVMNADQFFEFRKQAHRTEGDITGNETDAEIAPIILENNELKSWERGESVDWMDKMLNENAGRQDYQLSVSTGSENVRNYFSLSHVDEKGLQENTGFSRITLKNNLELLSIASWLKLGNNLLFSYNDYNRMAFGINNQPAYYRLSPFSRIHEDDGSFTRFPQANDELLINPIAEIELSSQENSFTNFFNNLYFEVTPDFVNGLSYRMNFGSTLRNSKEAIYWPRGTWLGDANNGLAEVDVSRLWDYTWENIMNYSKSFENHKIDLTALFSRQSHDFERTTSGASGFVTDDLLWYNLNAGENPILPGPGFNPKNEWDLVSYMGRMNYNFDEKYYATATMRKDGYSGFALNKKYGVFLSAALAWRISSESFLNNINWINDIKIRASYGTVGNQAVGTYRSLAQLRNAPYVFGDAVVGGVKVNSLRNDNLGWERATTFNLGMDFAIIDGRISGALDFYQTATDDLLLNREIPKITGQNDILFNIGQLKNVGFEFALNTVPVRTDDFTWKLGLNFSSNQNQITDLYGDQKDDIQNQWFIGQPLNVIYDFQFDGIWQLGQESEIAESATPNREPGDVRIKDQNNDGVIDAEDRVIVGVQQPDWLGGVTSTFSYKNLSLNIFVQTVQGIERKFIEEGVSARFNKAPYDYWTPENPSNTWFRPRINAGPTPLGSIGVYDGSYTRIKDVTLSYVLPSSVNSKLGLGKVRIYVNLHDFFTFTKFPYVDPESAAYAQISIPKYVLFGLNISF